VKIKSYVDFCAWRAATLDATPERPARLIMVLTDDEAITLFKALDSRLKHDPRAGYSYRNAESALAFGDIEPLIHMVHDAVLMDVQLKCTRRCLDAT